MNNIFGTFGVEMRACGQKLVKFCTLTHAAKISSRDDVLFTRILTAPIGRSIVPVELSSPIFPCWALLSHWILQSVPNHFDLFSWIFSV